MVEPYNVAYTSILIKVGKGHHVTVRAWPRPSRSAWAETTANAWLPIQTNGRTLILRRESKFPKVKSRFDPLCVSM